MQIWVSKLAVFVKESKKSHVFTTKFSTSKIIATINKNTVLNSDSHNVHLQHIYYVSQTTNNTNQMHHDHDTTEYIYTNQFHQISPFSNTPAAAFTKSSRPPPINPIYSLISLGGSSEDTSRGCPVIL